MAKAEHELPKQPGEDFFAELRERFTFASSQDSDDRKAAEEDTRFAAGGLGQWDPKTVKARKKRPVLTENRLGPSIAQIVNDGRQNKPAILTMPLDGGTEETAEYFQGRIRQIEYECDADIAYDTSREQQVTSGRGFYRVTTKYKKGNDGAQEIEIQPIRNQFSVSWDPSAKKYDLSDAGWMFVVDEISVDEHNRRFGKNTRAAGFLSDGENPAPGWLGIGAGKMIRVADYYVREMDAEGDWKVKIYATNGVDVLDETDWIGSTIPVIPVFGRQAVVDGKKQNVSLIRNSKEPQKLVNLYVSNIAEQISRIPKVPYLAAEGQLIGHEDEWETVNEVEKAFLQYKTRDSEGNTVGAPTRNQFEPPIAALVRGYLQAIDAVKATMGIFDASLGANRDDVSGIAIARRQKEADVTNLHFADNEARSRKYLGRILLEIIPLIDGYDPAEKPIRDEAGNSSLVKINEPFEDVKRKKTVAHMLEEGEYQVGIRTGPSYTSQRMEENERLGEVIKAAPDLMYVFGDKYFETSDGPGAKAMAERMERFIQMKSPGLIEPKENDPQQQMQQITAKAEQLGQQNEQLAKQVEELTRQINEKRAEQDAKVQIVQLQEETKRIIAEGSDATKLAIAEIGATAQTETRRVSDEFAAFQSQRARAHEVGMAAMQHVETGETAAGEMAEPPAEQLAEPQELPIEQPAAAMDPNLPPEEMARAA